ncbi:esterase [Mucor ambiguus]|uniref:Esterase n=1 Tax=Mucor ambiguus TaxID=91626 RepID=A0A0C9LRZ4_9FUNG|nr:esterase [Mucor ambiguus]
MPEYKPFPLAPKAAEIIKSVYNIESDEEACQPRIVRDFFDKATEQIETSPVEKEDREITHNNIKVNISILRPVGSKDKVLPVIMFLHGGGWVFGSYNTHKILTNELVNLVPACVIFVHYSLSPEVKYPVALEECYATLCWIQENAASLHVDANRLAVSGDSAGGNLSAALTILAKSRQNKGISYQVLYYPVLDIDFNNESYNQNKDNLFLPRTTMEYVWDAYITSTDQHTVPTVVPMSASAEVLQDLPPALIITAESDVLRSEGEAYAKKLNQAGVDAICVRYNSIGHGFVSMPVLKPQGVAAIAQTVDLLRKQWSPDSRL